LLFADHSSLGTLARLFAFCHPAAGVGRRKDLTYAIEAERLRRDLSLVERSFAVCAALDDKRDGDGDASELAMVDRLSERDANKISGFAATLLPPRWESTIHLAATAQRARRFLRTPRAPMGTITG
jgi:hypothetical protein